MLSQGVSSICSNAVGIRGAPHQLLRYAASRFSLPFVLPALVFTRLPLPQVHSRFSTCNLPTHAPTHPLLLQLLLFPPATHAPHHVTVAAELSAYSIIPSGSHPCSAYPHPQSCDTYLNVDKRVTVLNARAAANAMEMMSKQSDLNNWLDGKE
jgi:hypothetical protein